MVKKIFAKCYIYFILFLMYLPILILVAYSFTTSDQVGVWTGFSFKLYSDLFKNKDLMEAVGNTLLIAFCSAIVSTILGTLGAIGSHYSKKKSRKLIETMTQLPVVNAEIVMALSLAVLVVALSWSFSFLTLLIGHVVLTVPFVVLNVIPKLKQMDVNTYEAALDLGLTDTQKFFKVILPMSSKGIVTGSIMVFLPCLSGFAIPQILGDGNIVLIGNIIEDAFKNMSYTIGSLLAVVILIVILLGIFIVSKIDKEGETLL